MGILKKPFLLEEGDKLVVVSPSWGGAYDEPSRYMRGKNSLKEIFKLNVVDSYHAKHDPKFLTENPQARADDLMRAFEDKTVKAIMASIGGLDSIRLLEHIDFDIIQNNPKIFIGFSDITCVHHMCLKAGLASFYGPSVIANLGAPNLSKYTISEMRAALFEKHNEREIPLDKNNPQQRKILQGQEKVYGRLVGGCLETFQSLSTNGIWPSTLKNTILFMELVPSVTSVERFKDYLRVLGNKDVFNVVSGILFGRIGDEKGAHINANDYNKALQQVVDVEFGCSDLPIVANFEIGHTASITTLPYNAIVEIEPIRNSVKIKEPIVNF